MPGKDKYGRYLYYSGLGFQMIATIGVCTFIGYKIDAGRSSEQPLFTALFALLGVGISLYTTIRALMKKDKDK